MFVDRRRTNPSLNPNFWTWLSFPEQQQPWDPHHTINTTLLLLLVCCLVHHYGGVPGSKSAVLVRRSSPPLRCSDNIHVRTYLTWVILHTRYQVWIYQVYIIYTCMKKGTLSTWEWSLFERKYCRYLVHYWLTVPAILRGSVLRVLPDSQCFGVRYCCWYSLNFNYSRGFCTAGIASTGSISSVGAASIYST